jgi:hypothetical protein
MHDHSNERWVALYQAALLELDPALLEERISVARVEINRRSSLLEASVGESGAERIAMSDALTQLRSLENIQQRRQA